MSNGRLLQHQRWSSCDLAQFAKWPFSTDSSLVTVIVVITIYVVVVVVVRIQTSGGQFRLGRTTNSHKHTHTHVYRYSNVFIVIIPGFGIDAVCLFVCFFLLVFSIRCVTTMNDSVSLSVSVDLAAITYANQASHVEDLLNEENNPMKCIYCFAHLAER